MPDYSRTSTAISKLTGNSQPPQSSNNRRYPSSASSRLSWLKTPGRQLNRSSSPASRVKLVVAWFLVHVLVNKPEHPYPLIQVNSPSIPGAAGLIFWCFMACQPGLGNTCSTRFALKLFWISWWLQPANTTNRQTYLRKRPNERISIQLGKFRVEKSGWDLAPVSVVLHSITSPFNR